MNSTLVIGGNFRQAEQYLESIGARRFPGSHDHFHIIAPVAEGQVATLTRVFRIVNHPDRLVGLYEHPVVLTGTFHDRDDAPAFMEQFTIRRMTPTYKGF